MAFHQPTRQSLQRVIRPVNDETETPRVDTQGQIATDESQTWVLFSPATETTTSASYLSESEQSIPTPGRSRLSDLGSLHTVARSDRDTDSRQSVILSAAVDDESVEDDAELDSLDSHLPDFRTIPSSYNQLSSAPHAIPVLPAHDGLGSFRLDRAGLGSDVQEQLYAFERFNPRRVKRRRESLELAQLESDHDEEQQADKLQRIEAWRLEQSRILLEEIHKETRRRRMSSTSTKPQRQPVDRETENLATLSTMDNGRQEAEPDTMDWHGEPASPETKGHGIFARITRKVIRDLIGIDDRLLSILLGEELPEEDDLSSTPKAHAPVDAQSQVSDEPTWHLQILDRVAKELGLLVNQLSNHPGAFSTYVRMQQAPLPYAGLPAIPEAAVDMPNLHATEDMSPSMPQFQPTIAQQAQPISIPGSRVQPDSSLQTAREDLASTPAFTQAEWEQELDIKLVFKYLRSCFSARSATSPTFTSGTSHLATSSTQDSAAKAARVRQHHPLVSRARPTERRTFKATTPSSPAAIRHASSCASQSTRRSARRSSVSSRHYWDIGGSLGTGSMIASAGPMGSWGEV